MGMFDYYRPVPLPECPQCGKTLIDWQGKEADCGLFLWQQGSAAPIDQLVDTEVRLLDDQLREKRLPEKFAIHTYVEDCDCGQFTADCTCLDGIWTTCELRSK